MNYYTLCLAALAKGLESGEFARKWADQAAERAGNDPKLKKQEDRDEATAEAREMAREQIKAALGWREAVRKTWTDAQRKAIKFPGPHKRLAGILGVEPDEADSVNAFNACAGKALANCQASQEAQAAAFLRLLDLAEAASDLSQFAVSKLPFLCSAPAFFSAGDDQKANDQLSHRQRHVRRILEATPETLPKIAAEIDLKCFYRTPPTKPDYAGEKAHKRLLDCFDGITKPRKQRPARYPQLLEFRAEFEAELKRLLSLEPDKLRVPDAKKPPGEMAPTAVFKFLPCVETWEVCKTAVAGVIKRTVLENAEPDPLAEVRSGGIVFDYFTNRACIRPKGEKPTRAVWFEFDLAAFMEAIGKPHRYFQDTQTRLKERAKLGNKLKQIEEGEAVATADNEEDEGIEEEHVVRFGFKDDPRIPLLRELVTKKLGYLADAETPEGPRELVEYTIQERTLRGWTDIRDGWHKLVAAEKWAGLPAKEQEDKLWDVVKKTQGEHRDDFGSAALFRALLEPHFQPIWREDRTKLWHAPDALRAWRDYTELRFELADVERPIRFTPAHAVHSPRYFIIPKQGRYGSEHEAGPLALTTGIVLKTERGWEPATVRIRYAAPRLFRDQLRRVGDSGLESVPWLQPMMQALGLPEPDRADFSNCRVTLQPASEDNIQLTFPVPVEPVKLQALLGHKDKWNYQPSGKGGEKNFGQFNYSASEPRVETSLRWALDIAFAKEAGQPRKREPEPWHREMQAFTCLSVDLGQRGAGAYARIEARCDGKFATNKQGQSVPTRFIGETEGKQWRAALAASGLFRLPGEDAKVWREQTELDPQKRKPKDSGKPFDMREEFWGDRGRPAEPSEADETAELMRQFEAVEKDAEGREQFPLLPADWRDALTFPEQNDKLLIAARRAQLRAARLHRWCWFLADEAKRSEAAKEMSDCGDERLLSAAEREQAKQNDPRLADKLRTRLEQKQNALPPLLLQLANRIVPLRGRVWAWNPHPDPNAREGRCHRLGMSDSPAHKPMIRGQRGLSFPRIEQIEELRKRFQSLNQTLRREPGTPPPKRRDDSIPDPCPALLDKLDEIKTQRVNQTAHMILAAALGLKLAPPPENKAELRSTRDVHGQYVREREPVDFIIIEDLRAYRASQGRGRKENWRLVRWCIGHVRDKLRELREPFGIPLVETPAAYSSRFCARSGVAGFRAVEVTPGFAIHGHWAWLAGKKDDEGNPTADAQWLLNLDRQLCMSQTDLEPDWKVKHPGQPCPKRTALVPQAGGPIFVPVAAAGADGELAPKVTQADINAAINLGLRAIADPKLWSIHPRLRTKRLGDSASKPSRGKGARNKRPAPAPTDGLPTTPTLFTREKRKFGEIGIELKLGQPAKGSALEDTANPNYFRDFSGVAKWDEAEVQDPVSGKSVTLASGKALWSAVKKLQWERCREINDARLAAWRNKLDPFP